MYRLSLKAFVLVLTPLLLSPLLIFLYHSKEARCGFVVLLMAIYWTLEPIPTPVTALLPVVLLPTLGLATTEDACTPYLKATNMLFLACLMFAIAVESSNLHKRIALKILCFIGSDYKYLLLGFMLTTAFLGMWIINTAAAAMMLPIVDAVIAEIFPENNIVDESEVQLQPIHCSMNSQSFRGDEEYAGQNEIIIRVPKDERIFQIRLKKLLYLSIAYSATIGGTSTLTSNGPNLVLKFVVEDISDYVLPVDYTKWLIFCGPGALVTVILCWFTFKLLYIREDWRIKQIGAPRQLIAQKYKELGPTTFHEISVLILFSTLILLWMFRDPHFFKGWIHIFGEIKPKDATAAIFIAILLFVIPSKPCAAQTGTHRQSNVGLLDWTSVQRKLPWGIVLLRGGGFSMAEAVSSSGLSELMGEQLSHLSFISLLGIIVLFSVLTAVFTEFASNSATATILLPVAGQLASSLNVNPLLLLIPITLSSSFAFVLPVGTPANALVFEHAKLNATDMIIPGLITKLISVIVMLLNMYTFGYYLFDLHSIPAKKATLL